MYMDSRFWPTRQSMVNTHGEGDGVHKKTRATMSGVWSRVDHLVHFKNDVRHNIERIKII